MSNINAKRDDNFQPVVMAETDDANRETSPLVVDPVTKRLKTTTTVTSSALPTGAATSDNQTNGNQKTQLVYSDGVTEVGVQYPLSIDGDSVYPKDIDLVNSTKVGWTGNIVDLFTDPNVVAGLYNDTSTNPKVIYLAFNRTLYLSSIGLGCNLTGKTFSNTKIEFIGSDLSVRATADYSTDSTKYGTKLYSFPPLACVAIKLSFLTANTDVGLTNITIQKELPVRSRIRALKTDGTAVDIGASNNGSLNTNIRDEQTNKRTEVDSLGQLKTVQSVTLVGTAFENGTKDPNFWTEAVTGSGSITQDGEIYLNTGTTADSTASYTSVRKGRKVPGAVNQLRSVARLTTDPQANNLRRLGAYTDTDGFFFQINGTTFGIGSRKNSVDTIVNSGSFNGNWGTSVTMDTTVRRLVIDMTEFSVRFFVDDILLHTLTGVTESLTSTLTLPVKMENVNSGGNTTDNGFEVRFASIQRLGNIITAGTYKYLGTNATTVCKYGAGTLQRIINVDNAGNVSVYDNTAGSGTLIAQIDTSKALGTLDFNVPFSNGLTIVVGLGAKIIVVYE